jgi:hypothetical protein
MRTIQTFILRLLVDTDHPDVVCGALQILHDGEKSIPFRHEVALIALLKHLAREQMASNSVALEKKEN